MPIANAETSELIRLSEAIQHDIPGEPSYSTVWRWIVRGLAPAIPGEPRIKLAVEYVGAKPFTSRAYIRDFIDRSTQARIERIAHTQQRADDVSDHELQSVGLTGRRA